MFRVETFDPFIRGIVNISWDENEMYDIKIGAAKEFTRHLTSQSESSSKIQFQKWIDLSTKDLIKIRASAARIVVAFQLNKFVVDIIHNTIIKCFS